MNRIMIDIETMGKGSNAAILAIGAVKFNDHEIIDRFYSRANLYSCEKLGMDMDADTVLWWMKQNDDARLEFTDSNIQPISLTLMDFSRWCNKIDEVWGNGSDFDNVILKNAYQKCEIKAPWSFWQNRCYRTMKNIHKNIEAPEFKGIKHNAADDAHNQALHLIKILQSL